MTLVSFDRASFLHTVAKINAERDAALRIVERVRANIDQVWDRELPASWCTAGVVQELTAVAAEALDADPRESLALAQFALAVATSIPAARYPLPVQAQLEGSVWKEIGTAHRYLSEYDAALRAYDAAKQSFAEANALAHDMAVVDFARALVLSDLGKHDDALAILAQTTNVFEEFHDDARLGRSTLLKGMIHQRQGNLALARDDYEATIQALRDTDDLATFASTYSNLGDVLATLGHTNDAVSALQHARDLFLALNNRVELTRTEWVLARVLLTTGTYERALPLLQTTREQFQSRHMVEEAALSGLDLVEALLATNATRDAIALTQTILGECERARLTARTITALSYLRDVLSNTNEPRRLVRHVRTYVEALPTDPQRVFLPPDEQ